MAKKKKAASKPRKALKKKKKVAPPKAAKKTAKKKAAGSKARAKVSKAPARRVRVEPSSGTVSSSLDPKLAGRLQLRDSGRRLRREQIGDLQGISLEDRADSESVGELLEEGQTLEAEAVQGVEDALDADQGEVRTHEVPEDDVPEEYLDKD